MWTGVLRRGTPTASFVLPDAAVKEAYFVLAIETGRTLMTKPRLLVALGFLTAAWRSAPIGFNLVSSGTLWVAIEQARRVAAPALNRV